MLRKCKILATYLFGGIEIFGFHSGIIQVIPKRIRRKAWFSKLSIIRSIIEEYQVDLVLDVGANKG